MHAQDHVIIQQRRGGGNAHSKNNIPENTAHIKGWVFRKLMVKSRNSLCSTLKVPRTSHSQRPNGKTHPRKYLERGLVNVHKKSYQ